MDDILLPDDLEDQLADLTPEQLDSVERTAARLAEKKRRQQRIEEQERVDADNETPTGVPPKANKV